MTQAEKNWLIAKNNLAYYLQKLKEQGVWIAMENVKSQPLDVKKMLRLISGNDIYPSSPMGRSGSR